MFKIINYFFQSIIIYFFFFIALILRIKISRAIFSNLFSLVGPIFKSKKISNNNLQIFSKNISAIAKESILKNMWKNYGMTFIEYMFLKHFKKQSSHVSIYGENNLSGINEGNPVIFVSGHFANFELMSMEITKKNIKLATIYRPLNNIFLNPIMEYLRKKYICKNQIKKGINGVREAISYIKNDHSIALMIDQRVSEGEKIDLFGKAALTTTLPAQLSKKYMLNIIPVYIERLENNNFKIEFKSAIKPGDFADKTDLSIKLNKVLEEMILRNPGQWIWSHNRWK
jgi:KDO2-lipid IV(A) lauroyltransferase